MYVFPQSFSRRWSRRWTAPKSCASTSSRIPGTSPAVFKRWRKPSLNLWMVSLFLPSVRVRFSRFLPRWTERGKTQWNCPNSQASSLYLLEWIIAPQHRPLQQCRWMRKLDNGGAFPPPPSSAPFISNENKQFCYCWRAAWTHVYTLTNVQAEDHMTLMGKVSCCSQPTKSK